MADPQQQQQQQPPLPREPHLLSLKVARAARPHFGVSENAFHLDHPSLSTSLSSIDLPQGFPPTPSAKPKPTTSQSIGISPLLNLPIVFGAIHLGETFNSSLTVNNESQHEIYNATLRVEMHNPPHPNGTPGSKALLTEISTSRPVPYALKPGQALSAMVSHEIKEIGLHVLLCTVTYEVPDRPSHTGEGLLSPKMATAQNLRSFRKAFKFQVTHPLSVKSKVYIPKSPTTIHSHDPGHSQRIYLEVLVQATSQPMWFERMKFEPAEGLEVIDANQIDTHDEGGENGDTGRKTEESIFSSSLSLLNPSDIRQYLYIISPSASSTSPPPVGPGAQNLGRLDIKWRTTMGEIGNLQTSQLTRKISAPPPLPIQQAPPLVSQMAAAMRSNSPHPPQPGSSSTSGGPFSPTVRSPLAQQPQNYHRSQSPPPLQPPAPQPISLGSILDGPLSPTGSNASGSGVVSAFQRGTMSPPIPSTSPSPLQSQPPRFPDYSDLEVELVALDVPHHLIRVRSPFDIRWSLKVVDRGARRRTGPLAQKRRVSLAVQHVDHFRSPPQDPFISSPPPQALQQPNIRSLQQTGSQSLSRRASVETIIDSGPQSSHSLSRTMSTISQSSVMSGSSSVTSSSHPRRSSTANTSIDDHVGDAPGRTGTPSLPSESVGSRRSSFESTTTATGLPYQAGAGRGALEGNGDFADLQDLRNSISGAAGGGGGQGDRLAGLFAGPRFSSGRDRPTLEGTGRIPRAIIPPPVPLVVQPVYNYQVRDTRPAVDNSLKPSRGLVCTGQDGESGKGSLVHLEDVLFGYANEGSEDEVEDRAAREFTLSYVPFEAGIARVGGLRVMLLSSDLVSEEQGEGLNGDGGRGAETMAYILKEWDVFQEVWVRELEPHPHPDGGTQGEDKVEGGKKDAGDGETPYIVA